MHNRFARAALCGVLTTLWLGGVIFAQTSPPTSTPGAARELTLGTGKEIFDAACIGCHGPGGRGQP